MGRHFVWELPTLYERNHPLVKDFWNSQPKLFGSCQELSWEIDKFSSRFFRHHRILWIIHKAYKSQHIVCDHRKHVPGLIGNELSAGKIIESIRFGNQSVRDTQGTRRHLLADPIF